jgi:hypothetical protein
MIEIKGAAPLVPYRRARVRSSMVVVWVAGAGIAAATLVLRTEVRAAGSEPVILGDMSQLMKDPAYREAKRADIRSHLAESGVELAQDLDLTTSQLNQLVDLETEFQMGVLDSFVPSGPGKRPDPVASQASVAKQRALRSKLDADIVAALGAEKAQQFRDYVKSQTRAAQDRDRGQSSATEERCGCHSVAAGDSRCRSRKGCASKCEDGPGRDTNLESFATERLAEDACG